MALATRQDSDGRSAEQPLLLDIPPASGEERMTGGRKAGDMRHLAASDEREASTGGEAQDIFQPEARNFFDDSRGRPAGVKRGVLVPGRGQPIGGQSGRQRPTDYPSKETAACRPEQPTIHILDKLINNLLRIDAFTRQRLAQSASQSVYVGCSGD